MTEVVALPGDGDQTTWEVRRDGHPIGTATTHARRGGLLLDRLTVPEAEAADALEALLSAMTGRGEESLRIDVASDDRVLAAAIAGREPRLAAAQMRFDLSAPVTPPARVTLRPMTAAEFAGYRDHLVTAYAQDLVEAGAFPDQAAALDASEESTRELLPDGPDTPGQHLWTAYDADTRVGILWIHVEGSRAFIYDIEVDADQRRRGYGREVLDAGALAARELGADVLGLNVFEHNPGARSMYERAGYETTERTYRIDL